MFIAAQPRGRMLRAAMYEHVLALTDGSHEADRAVEAAAELARGHRARLTLAAVVDVEHPGRHCAYGSELVESSAS